jgi:hypothetical protein
MPPNEELPRYVVDAHGQYVKLDPNLLADHTKKIIKVYGRPANWPDPHPKWRTVQIEINEDIGNIPPIFVVLKKDISDELDNLDL